MKKKSKNKLFITMGKIILTLSVVALLFITRCSEKEESHHDVYTCPMHPTFLDDKPGSCPVCGMDLMKKNEATDTIIDKDLTPLLSSPNEVVVSSISSVKVGANKKEHVTIEAQGIVTYDERSIYTVSSRTGGRLEKVFLKYSLQQIRKGERIVEIYSPELLAAQRELLFLLESNPENESLVRNVTKKISLLGVSDSQIKELILERKIKNTVSIYSPYNGYVLEEGDRLSASVTSPAIGMSNGMGVTTLKTSMKNAASQAGKPVLREGSYVEAGQVLFNIVNTSALAVELSLPSSQAGAINTGDEVELNFGDGNSHAAKIDFVSPSFNQGQEFLSARVYIKNPGVLQIGALVKAIIKDSKSESLWVPKETVIDLGADKIVFIKTDKVFKPQKVITGKRHNDLIEIRQGLSSGDEIATSAQYMVDSDSFINIKK